jgi:hypothetical protein
VQPRDKIWEALVKIILTCSALCLLSFTAAQAQSTTGNSPAGSSATSDSGTATKGTPDTSATLPSGSAATPSPAAPLQSPESKKEGQDGPGAPTEPAKK